MDSCENFPIFNEIVNKRYSCRKYSHEPLTRETILEIIETARMAPSACNKQPWKFIVVEAGTDSHKAVLSAYNRPWIADVQVFIIACGLHDEAWHRADGKDHTDIDVAIAVEHICLAASSLGIGSCWICNFDKTVITESLGLPSNEEPIAIIPLGYPLSTETVPEKKRKAMNEILTWGKF